MHAWLPLPACAFMDSKRVIKGNDMLQYNIYLLRVAHLQNLYRCMLMISCTFFYRVLNLSSNALLWFDYAFIPRSLEVLDIHSNNIDSLGNFYALRDYNNLKYIDASVNAISSLNVLSILPGVVEINLSNNTVSHIAPKTFTGKKYLTKIHLERNRLETLDEASLMVTLGPNNRKLIL